MMNVPGEQFVIRRKAYASLDRLRDPDRNGANRAAFRMSSTVRKPNTTALSAHRRAAETLRRAAAASWEWAPAAFDVRTGVRLTPRRRKTDSNSRSHREGKGYGEPLQASIAVSDLNL